MLTALLFLMLVTACAKGGVTFTLHNAGDKVISGAVVWITGSAYHLGDLLPGDSKSLPLVTRGDSHIEMAQVGNPKLAVDSHFGPGYQGAMANVTQTEVIAGKRQLTAR